MSIIVDYYRINWARRYIREAKADLSIAKESPIIAVSISLALLAMRNSQTAVYYSLRNPRYLASLVSQSIKNEKKVKNTVMRILVQMERLIQRYNRLAEKLDKHALVEEAHHLLEIASKIVDLVIDGAEEQSS